MAPDELGQLLTAETFAAGRWTNPAHPHWVHFEAAFILQHPTYNSKYWPGPPLLMALGIVLTGYAWAGVLLTAAFMCGAICWMLQGWLSPRWALAGALLAVVRYTLHHDWLNSYWGGSLAAFGGALVLGSLPRLLRKGNKASAFTMAAGFVVLFVSRPYEGLLFSLVPGLLVLRYVLRGDTGSLRQRFTSVLLPIVLVGAAAAIPFGYYNAQVTGSPIKAPYTAYTQQYEPVPHFIWLDRKPQPVYNHAEFTRFFNWWGQVEHQRTVNGIAARAAHVLGFPVAFSRAGFLHPKILMNAMMAVALVVSLMLVARDRKMRVPMLMLGLVILGLIQETSFFDHYAAPAVSAVFLIVMQGLRRVSLFRCWRKGAGQGLPVLLSAGGIVAVTLYGAFFMPFAVHPPQHISVDRPRVMAHVQRYPGKHLILAHFDSAYSIHDGEWIGNAPDIDDAPVIWARDMGDQGNRKLLEYYRDREVWHAFKTSAPVRLYRAGDPMEAALSPARSVLAKTRGDDTFAPEGRP